MGRNEALAIPIAISRPERKTDMDRQMSQSHLVSDISAKTLTWKPGVRVKGLRLCLERGLAKLGQTALPTRGIFVN